MDPVESCEMIIKKIKESNLHYILHENAFSVEIKLRKKFISPPRSESVSSINNNSFPATFNPLLPQKNTNISPESLQEFKPRYFPTPPPGFAAALVYKDEQHHALHGLADQTKHSTQAKTNSFPLIPSKPKASSTSPCLASKLTSSIKKASSPINSLSPYQLQSLSSTTTQSNVTYVQTATSSINLLSPSQPMVPLTTEKTSSSSFHSLPPSQPWLTLSSTTQPNLSSVEKATCSIKFPRQSLLEKTEPNRTSTKHSNTFLNQGASSQSFNRTRSSLTPHPEDIFSTSTTFWPFSDYPQVMCMTSPSFSVEPSVLGGLTAQYFEMTADEFEMLRENMGEIT